MKVLKFYADWCGPCKAYAPIFESAAKSLNFEYENINIDKDTTGLAAEHKVQSIPTTIFIKEDGTIEKKVGLLQESQIKEIIENA